MAPLLGKLPHPVSADVAVSPFKIEIPEDDIKSLKTLLKLLPIAQPNVWNLHTGRDYGVSRKWVTDAVEYWQSGYDWRKQEDLLNSIPQFKAEVKDDDGETYSVHFAAVFSENKNAVPVVITHGWPGTFLESVPILLKLQKQYGSTPEKMPYHLIAPSMTGFGFSSPPTLKRTWTSQDVARLNNKVMIGLGFGERGYVAQGGDLGAVVTNWAALNHAECKASHVNLWFNTTDPPWDPSQYAPKDDVEKHAVGRMKEFRTLGSAYLNLHATRPSTAGLAIGSSPIALLAWIGEKMVDWSDPRYKPSLDTVLTNISIYWFTQTYPTSLWGYLNLRDRLATLPDGPGNDPRHSDNVKPTGFSWFPNDLVTAPKAYFTDNKFYTHFYAHDKGGHFAQLEVPDELWADVEDFVSKVWKT